MFSVAFGMKNFISSFCEHFLYSLQISKKKRMNNYVIKSRPLFNSILNSKDFVKIQSSLYSFLYRLMKKDLQGIRYTDIIATCIGHDLFW